MKKAIVLLGLLCCMLAGCSKAEEGNLTTTNGEEGDFDNPEIGRSVFNHSCYDGGALVNLDKTWVFDEASVQMVPLCSRLECTHEEEDCPAVSLANRAAAVIFYEDEIWYLSEKDSMWEFGTVDYTGENQNARIKIDMEGISPGSQHLIYEMKYYTEAFDIRVSEDTGELLLKNYIIEVDLENGEVTQKTEGVEMDAGMRMRGVYGENLYYTIFEKKFDGRIDSVIYQLNINTNETTRLTSCGIDAMNGQWLAYCTPDPNSEVILQDLSTNTRKTIYKPEAEENALITITVSRGNVIIREYIDGQTKTYFYEIKTGKTTEYQTPYPYVEWHDTGSGWLVYTGDPGLQTQTLSSDWYFYIEETMLQTGEEPIRVK